VTPCFAKTYFVKPEQSNPSFGVLPPQVYRVPTYASAVWRSRAAFADGAGDDGIRRVRGSDEDVVRGMAAMTVEMTVAGDTPSVADDAQPVTNEERTAATAPTRGRARVVMARRKSRCRAERCGSAN
jgi:hypothetical protein